MKRLLMNFSIVVLSIATAAALPKTIRVPQDQPTVQAGIDAAVNGDTVLVAEGTYNVNILLTKKIVLGSLYIVDRDTSHISKTILDGGTPSTPDSASVIRIGPGTDTTTVVAGFTIRNGNGTISQDQFGSWLGGGGVHILSGGARITRNIITGNSVTSSTRYPIGGGICAWVMAGQEVFWIIEENRIASNTVSFTGPGTTIGAGGGGAVLTQAGRFEKNIVTDNVVTAANNEAYSGGVHWEADVGRGAQVLVIANNLIRGNVARVGGGLLIGAAGLQWPADRPVCSLVNNIIAGNTASGVGGAMRILSGDYVLVNNTIADNVSSGSTCAVTNGRGSLTFKMLNNIFWNPSTTAEFSQPALVAGSYNDIRGGLAGTDNINADPKFISGDPLYRLAYNSPCIGAGGAAANVGGLPLSAPVNDHLGAPRPQPAGSSPDLGAIENPRATLAGRIRVPQDQPTVQAGIDGALNGDTVLVSEGIYHEQIRFKGKAITVTSLFALDKDTSHVRKTIIDGNLLSNPDSSSVVYFLDGEDTTSVLMGFTVQGGHGTLMKDYPGIVGGGVLILGSSAKLLNNIITKNTLQHSSVAGAGVVIGGDTLKKHWLVMEGNTVTNNHARGSTGGGGGISAWGVNVRIAHNVITHNTAYDSIAGAGAGVILQYTGYVQLLYNDISNNFLYVRGMSTQGFAAGGAVYISDIESRGSAKVLIGNCVETNSVVCDLRIALGGACTIENIVDFVFAGNLVKGNTVNSTSSSNGGALSFWRCPTGRIENNLIVQNAALGKGRGGGLHLAEGVTLAIVNNTIVNNTVENSTPSSARAGGLNVENTANAYTFNNIFWGNSNPQGGAQISVASGGSVGVAYSNVQGGWTGVGNINVDPLFAPNDTVYNLSKASPCIGRGIDSMQFAGVWHNAPAYDFNGDPRPAPGHEQGPDMGAQEEQIAVDVAEPMAVPRTYELRQNYPNPFNPATVVSYQLPVASQVRIAVYDLLGREVTVLVDEKKGPGNYDLRFDASGLATGVYLYRLIAGDFVRTRKMTLVR